MGIKVEYYVDNVRYTVDSNSRSSHPKRIGSNVEVRYDPDNPDKAIIAGKDNGEWIVLVLGIVFNFCGILFLFKGLKERN